MINSNTHIVFDLDDTLISESKWYMDKWKKCDFYIEKKYNIVGFYEKISQIILEGPENELKLTQNT